MADDYGHKSIIGTIEGCSFIMDSWGEGPFIIEVDGKELLFEESGRFGPIILNKSTRNPTEKQPGSRDRFWDAYGMWVKGGRKLMEGRVPQKAIWAVPKRGEYWKDQNGLMQVVREPDLDHLGWRRIPPPHEQGRE